MKTLKIIGIILFITGVVIQVISYLSEGATSPNSFLTDTFVWGAVITCLGALLWTIYRLIYLSSTKPKLEPIIFHGRNHRSKAHDSYKKYTNAGHEEHNKNIIVVDTNFTETVSDEDRKTQQIHCQLTTPGLWPCE